MATFYMDYENGNDATTNTPLGWWSVPYTSGNGTQPVADETATGDTSTSTAKVTVVTVTGGSWAGGNAAGIIYWYGKSAAFQAENLTFSGGATCTIGGDFTYCAWKTMTTGATAARIAPGDIIRIAKSPAPTSIGNGTWTNVPTTMPLPKNIASSTNASPIVITSNNHGYENGDIIYVQNHTTNLTANGTWTVANKTTNTFELENSVGVGTGGATGYCIKIDWATVKISASQTKTIDRCEVLWTAANSSIVTLDTSAYKEGDASVKITKSSGIANNTLYAYKTLTEIDLSSYQKISFWFRTGTALTTDTRWKICLCSDDSGATPVDTFEIPTIPFANYWTVLTLTKSGGGNLGSSIKSIALYSGSAAVNTSNIYMDNFIACTTSGINLQSLISKNTTEQSTTSSTGYANESWYGIQSISEDGTIIRLDNNVLSTASSRVPQPGIGYYGTTETVTTYKRETIKTTIATATSTQVQAIQDNGTTGSNIEFQGGYDITTNEQTGETFFDGQNGGGYGLYMGARTYITINYLNFYRYYNGCYIFNLSNNNSFLINNINNNSYSGFVINSSNKNNVTIINCNNNGSSGIDLNHADNSIFTIQNYNNNVSPLTISLTSNSLFRISNCNNTYGYGVSFVNSSNNIIESMNTNSNYSGGIINDYGTNYLYNVLIGNSVEFASAIDYANSRIYSQKHDQTTDYHYIYTDNGNIKSDTTTRHTASGISWKMSPTNAKRDITYPLDLSIAKIACVADKLVTVKAWFKKSHATQIGAQLICKGGQIAGVASDVTATKADDTDWEELTITFTPTEAGVVEIIAIAYYISTSTANSVYVDDMTITQAS